MRFWIIISAMCVASGWLLSAIGQLNERGYTVVFALGATFFAAVYRKTICCSISGIGKRRFKLLHRFRRPLPFLFLLLTVFIFLGGAIYPPNNYDGLTYRVPRVLNWLAENRWHWIETTNVRLNDRSCGFEWLMTPLLLFTRSDRFLFLINFLPFILLPGSVFKLFTELGVSPRVAWFWMWLLPAGYTFVLQAGSIGNDAFSAIYAVAAVHFALRVRGSKKLSDFWFSIIAAALLSGSKPGNLPLLLPWVIAISLSLSLLRVRPVATLAILILAAIVSFLPTAILNWVYCGDWTGMVLEPMLVVKKPVVGILGNTFISLLENFTPPVFPFAGWWNQNAADLLPNRVFALLESNFEPGYLKLGELQVEEAAGIGFAVCALLLITLITGLVSRFTYQGKIRPWQVKDRWRQAIRWSTFISLAVFFAKSGMIAIARIISPYYIFLFLPLLAGAAHQRAVRSKWWGFLTLAVLFSSLFVVVITPARPLFPLQTVLARVKRENPKSPLISRAEAVYAVYSNRNDLFASLRDHLPMDLRQVGFIASADDAETSLWRPFGSRRVIDLIGEKKTHPVMSWIVLKTQLIQEKNSSLELWLEKNSYDLVFKTNITAKVGEGAKEWCVVRRHD